MKSTREALLSVATQVIHPLVAGIKAELVSLIEALEGPAPTCTLKAARYSKTVKMTHIILACANRIGDSEDDRFDSDF